MLQCEPSILVLSITPAQPGWVIFTFVRAFGCRLCQKDCQTQPKLIFFQNIVNLSNTAKMQGQASCCNWLQLFRTLELEWIYHRTHFIASICTKKKSDFIGLKEIFFEMKEQYFNKNGWIRLSS